MPELIDPDPVDLTPKSPLHLHPGFLALAFLGGAVGSAARAGVALALPTDTVPYTTLTANVVGAFLLAALLTTLSRRGPDTGYRRRLRIAAGTGLMGGFTTYSALAVESVGLADGGSLITAVTYALGTIAAGALATWLGIAVVTAAHDRAGAGDAGPAGGSP